MDRTAPVASLTVPLGGQSIEMHPIEFEAGGMPLLRTRIREHSRFTVFDVDPLTAARWGKVLCAWAAAQPGMAAGSAGDGL